MIEVEKKFILSAAQKKQLLQGADFLGEKNFTDEYFDNEKFSLSTGDIWLRARNGEFELKLPMHQTEKKLIDQYQEIEGEKTIREIFAIPKLKSFREDIAQFGYQVFCTCSTKRMKYKKNGFAIDLDEVFYDDFGYTLCEIELMVEKKEEVAQAALQIEKFAKEQGLEIVPVRGKIVEFLKRKKPQHYQALWEAGILKGDEE